MQARHLHFLAASVALSAGIASAQGLSGDLQPVTSPLKDAGTYHLSTGKWTRTSGSVALAGPEVLYDNTCVTGSFLGLNSNEIAADSGRVPDVAVGGLHDTYGVNGFSISYCSYEPDSVDVQVAFWDCYQACDAQGNLSGIAPLAAYSLLSFPAGGPSGSQGCWIVSLDLANTTLAFFLDGYCTPSCDSDPDPDSFGWSWTVPGGTTGTTGSGPLLAGDPAMTINPSCGGVGDGTTFPGFNPALAGTGIGNIDQFELQSTVLTSGCYWFGGYSGASGSAAAGSNPWSGFYLELEGFDGGVPSLSGSSVCDCSGGNAPCGNLSPPERGCPNSNSNGLGAQLVGYGSSSVSSDSFALIVKDAAPDKPGLVLAGTLSLGPFGVNTVPDNAGLLCVAGSTRRGDVVFTDGTACLELTDFLGSPYGQSDIVSPGASVYYTYWFRDPGTAAGCANDGPGADFNFSNGWAQLWSF